MTRARPPERSFVARALAGHAAIGLLVSALIYLVVLSGTIVVVHDRWQRWEQPDIAETATLSPAAAQAAMIRVLAADRGMPRTTHFYLRMPTAALPRAAATTDRGGWYVDAAGQIAGRAADGWTEFVTALHEQLTLPATLSRILVGALGVALGALAVTGVIAHPRIVRDAFRLRSRSDASVARADWHNRLGVWTLPFMLAIAVTGAFIGLAGVGAGVLARAYTGGNTAPIYAPIFGAEPAPDPAPAGLPDIAAALTMLADRVPAATPTYVVVHDPATRGQHVQILAEHPRRLIYGESYDFDAAGRFRDRAGLSDGPVGQQVAASTYNLHFGNYGGPAVEAAYLIFGTALCVVTATGTTLWLRKRRRRGLGDDRLDAAWDVVCWGMPLALTATLWLRAIVGTDAPLTATFWALLAIGFAVAIVRPGWLAAGRVRIAAGIAIGATAAAHLGVFPDAAPGIVAIDVVAMLGAVAVLSVARSRTGCDMPANPASQTR